MIAMKYTALVTLASLIYTFMLSGKVGGMRPKSGVEAPATTGNLEFEKAFRVHYNTIEQLVLFIPVLWMATHVLGDMYAAAVGVVWIVGRVVYSNAYMKDPKNRTAGMLMTLAATGVLAIASLWGIVKAFM